MKKILYSGMGLLVLIGGIFVFNKFVASENYENIAVNELHNIAYGVQYTSEESSEILFKGFVESTSDEVLTISHGVFFTDYKVFDQTGNEVLGKDKRSGDYPTIEYITSIEESERLLEEMHTIIELPNGEYTILIQFGFGITHNPENVPTDLEVVVTIE